MIKGEGAGAATVIGGGALLNMLIQEGGFITPEILEKLSGLDFKTIAIVLAILYLYRSKKDDTFVCPYAKEKDNE